jgi:hypothetical protein
MFPNPVPMARALALMTLLLTLLAAPALAQSNPTIVDETEQLDTAAVQRVGATAHRARRTDRRLRCKARRRG